MRLIYYGVFLSGISIIFIVSVFVSEYAWHNVSAQV